MVVDLTAAQFGLSSGVVIEPFSVFRKRWKKVKDFTAWPKVAARMNQVTRLAMAARLAARAIRLDKGRIRSLSQELQRTLMKVLPRSDRPIGVKLWVNAPQSVRSASGEMIDYRLLVRSRPSRGGTQFVLGGGVGPIRSTGQQAMVIEINSSVSGAMYHRSMAGSDVMAKQLYKLLIHELTHLADPSSDPGSAPAGAGSEVPYEEEMDLHAYYNNSKEVRAHMQEIVDEVERYFTKYPAIADYHGLSKGFQLLMNLSSTWKEIRGYLTQRNRQLIMKAVHTAYRDWQETNVEVPLARAAFVV